jgi:hypothetical protein
VTAYSPYQPYPGPAPTFATAGPPPIMVATADPEPQRRVTVFFRLILAIPQLIVLYLLNIVAVIVLFIGWWAALFTGQLPEFAVTFLSGYLRWSTRVSAYLYLLTDVYPPFSMEDETGYPVRTAIPAPQPLNRAAVFFRYILALPANLLLGLVTVGAGTILGFVAWLIALVAGQLPPSWYLAYLAVLRYQARVHGYWLLLTPAYPSGLHGDNPGTVSWADEAPQGPGYGVQSSFQPTTWLLQLTAGARKLVTTFVVLGVVLLVGYIVVITTLVATVGQSDPVVANNAINSLNAAHTTLASGVDTFKQSSSSCGQKLSCVTKLDATAATDFHNFYNQLLDTKVPASATSDKVQLEETSFAISADFTELSHATSVTAYNAIYSSTGMASTLTKFDTQWTALGDKLESY